MTPAPIEPEIYRSMGLTDSEYALILQKLGRTPTMTEIGMFAVMWSEHCGYKFSRPVLAAFSEYKKSMEGAGLENAGVVPIGNGLGVTFKVESHNHPSAVEPYQGAATGVGGIIRDILTMGARPIAILDSLRFGPIHDGAAAPEVVARNRHLLSHVVSGIAGYGNCVGVPTVAGEVSFHPRYSGNPLVNAMCVGIVRLDEVTTAGATGVGNPVIYLGSSTGRDGIHGATFASAELDEDFDAKRPNVQIGDPFAEKSLIEATLEALQTGAIAAIQDMGAAGLTCSTIEMAAKGSVGMAVDLDLVPMRDPTMGAYELMLSESQERMLCVAHKGREGEVLAVFRKWELPAAVIGYVTEEPVVEIRRHGKIEASLNPHLLADECPVYSSPAEPSAEFLARASFDPDLVEVDDLHGALLSLLGHPDIGSKRPVYEQYDRHVQTQTVIDAGTGDAAVLHPDGADVALAVTLDGNARWTEAHPRRGGRLAVVEAARNVACAGARPIAATDGLNFGSPQDPHVFFHFREAVYGIAEAADAMGTPVVSGNVSFYNESEIEGRKLAVPATPLVGMVGIINDPARARSAKPNPGDAVYLLDAGCGAAEHRGLGASLLVATVLGQEDGYPDDADLTGELRLVRALAELPAGCCAAHDVSDGGIAVTLAEMALLANVGIDAHLPGERAVESLFGESPGRVVVASNEELPQVEGISIQKIGTVGGSEVKLFAGGRESSWTLAELRDRYENALVAAFSDPRNV